MNNLFETHSNDSDILNNFRITKSNLYFDTNIKETRSDWFYYAANNYKFKDDNFENLCEYNAKVALEFKRFNVYKDWLILKTIFKDFQKTEPIVNNNHHDILSASIGHATNTRNPVINSNETNLIGLQVQTSQQAAHNNQTNLMNVLNNSLTAISQSGPSSSTASSSSSCPASSSRLRNFSENSSDEIPIASTGNSFIVCDNTTNNPKSNRDPVPNQFENLESYNNIMSILNTDNQDEECIYFSSNLINKQNQFQQLQPMQLNQNQEEDEEFSILPSDIIEYNDDLNDEFFINEKSLKIFNDDLIKIPNNGLKFETFRDNQQAVVSSINRLTIKSNNKNDLVDNVLNPSQNLLSTLDLKVNDIRTDELKMAEVNLGLLQTSSVPAQIKNDFLNVDFKDYFQQLLMSYVNDENDLTTAIFMYLVASLNEKLDKNKIDFNYLDEWFSQYIELLSKFELWNLRIEIIKNCNSEFISNLTQNSLDYHPMCGTCKKTIKANTTYCPSCKVNNFLCVYCHLPVKRLYAWCHKCCHGGHLNHLIKWFKKNKKCPSGCGCDCQI